MKKSGIYLIKHKEISNLIYIGKSIDIDSRWKQHIKGFRSAKKLQEAFNKYGINSFDFLIIEECSENLGEKETYYIDFYDSWKNGLNGSRAGGEWGIYARSFVKNPNNFKEFNGSIAHKEAGRKGGSKGGLISRAKVYKLFHNNETYIFIGCSIIAEYLNISPNTFKSWATTGKKYKVFKNSSIIKLGLAKESNLNPNIVFKVQKSGELLEVFRREKSQK